MITQQIPRHLRAPNGPISSGELHMLEAPTDTYPLSPVRPGCLKTKNHGMSYIPLLTTVTASIKADIASFLITHFPLDTYPAFAPPSHTPYRDALKQYIDFVTQLDPFTPSPFSDGDMGSHHMFHSMTGTQTLTQETLMAAGLSDANARQLLTTLNAHHIVLKDGTVICRLELWTLDTLVPIIQTAPDPGSLLTHTPTIMAQLNNFLPHRHQGTVCHDELYLQLDQENAPSLLGQGNFGVVHKALLIAPNGTALSGALKQSLHFSPDALGDYMNEVAMQKRASDCNASIYNAFYMPMSGNRTPTFAIFMEKGTPSSSPLNLPNPTVSLSALSQLPDCLYHLNTRAGILHRDLKPTNIVMMDNGTTNIIDFGTSIPMDNLTHAQTVGSPAHMPPEAIKEGPSNATEDVWGLGTLLFSTLSHGQYYVNCFQPNTSLLELLYAAPPPPLDNEMQLFYRIGFELQKPMPVDESDIHLPNLAPESRVLLTRFFDLFTQMLDPDPSTRPSIQAVLEHPGSHIFQEPHRQLLSLLQTGLDSVDATSKRKSGPDAEIMIHAPTGQRSMRECLKEKGVQSKGIDPVLSTLGSMGWVDEDGQIRPFKQTDLSALALRLEGSPLCSEVLSILNECIHARHGYARDGIDLYYEVVPHQLRPKDLQALGLDKHQAKRQLDNFKQQHILNDDGVLTSDPSLQQAITYQPDDSVDTTKFKIALNNCYDSNRPHRSILGIGAYGTVYKTWVGHSGTYRPYALKKQTFDSPESLKKLKSEALLTQQLLSTSSPLLKGDTTLLMPGLPLGTPFPSQQLAVTHTHFCNLCRCINELHNVNEVEHMDLKPSNVMITADGTLTTLDFGGSRRSDSPEKVDQERPYEQTMVGSPLWMPPEAFKDTITPQVFGASDVWSLGIQLFSLLSVNNGQFSSHYVYNYRPDTPLESLLLAPQPPNEETIESLIQQQHLLSPPRTHTQHPILDLLAGMLHPDPTQRLTSDTCLQHVGFELLESILCSPGPHMAITRFHGELEGVRPTITIPQDLCSPTKASRLTPSTIAPSDTWPRSPISPIKSRVPRHPDQAPSYLLERRISR